MVHATFDHDWGIGDDPDNCYEDGGFCSPEYSSCVQCDSSGDVFVDPPGGGGGGDDNSDYIKFCNTQFLMGLIACNYKWRACRNRGKMLVGSPERNRPREAADAPVAESKSPRRGDEAASSAALEAMVVSDPVTAAADYGCMEQFDDCLLDLAERHQWCLGGGGWPEW